LPGSSLVSGLCIYKSGSIECNSVRVCFAPKATELLRGSKMTRCANSGLLHRSKQQCYSITSSARASSVGGTVKPNAFAVLRLMTNSNLVGP
jgi:hypothetical protein